jgi:hypothetical protein
MIDFTQTELFPQDRFLGFLHLKSHGSTDLLLTGLTDAQLKSKQTCQNDLIARERAKANVTWTVPVVTQDAAGQPQPPSAFKYGSAGFEVSAADRELISLLHLDKTGNDGKAGLGSPTDGGGDGLDVGSSINLSTGIGGLGTTGLSAANHFGSSQQALLMALRLLREDDGMKNGLGFVFLESCESKFRDKPLFGDYLSDSEDVKGYYSAIGSLWFRNIDWDAFFRDWALAAGDAQAFQTRMIAATKKMPNYGN